MAILVYLVHAVLFGYAARRVSEYRNTTDGFWWGFWLGALGLLIIIFRSTSEPETIRTPDPKWRCVKCGAYNSSGRERCQSCGAAQDAPDPTKSCPSCGAKNKASNTNCFACGSAFEN